MSLTIKRARKILGKTAKNLSDKQLKNEINTAVFLAELFIEKYPELRKNYSTYKV